MASTTAHEIIDGTRDQWYQKGPTQEERTADTNMQTFRRNGVDTGTSNQYSSEGQSKEARKGNSAKEDKLNKATEFHGVGWCVVQTRHFQLKLRLR